MTHGAAAGQRRAGHPGGGHARWTGRASSPRSWARSSSAAWTRPSASQLGAHYTSKEDILLIVEPVLMAPLRRRWAEVQAQARELARRRDEAKAAQAGRSGKRELESLLLGFAQELAQRPGPGRGVRERQLSLRGAAAAAGPVEGGVASGGGPGADAHAAPARAVRPRRSSCTASRSTSTPTSWRRRRSGSATFSGCTTTALGCPPSRS